MNREKLEKNIASNLTIDLDVEKYIEITLLDIEQYANQRVIEELEKLLNNTTIICVSEWIDLKENIEYKEVSEIKEAIKQLKQ